MPTPSSNPPPELPPRSHSSSCPDELRSPSSTWRPGQDGVEMNIDNHEREASTDTVGRTESSQQDDTTMIEDLDQSRSPTQSPRPDSRGGQVQPARAEGIDLQLQAQSQKSMDVDRDSPRETDASGAQASGTASAAYDVVSPPTSAEGASADSEKAEDAATMIPHDDGYAPSMGYDFSNMRVPPTSCSSYLRPGSKFKGTQQSERQVYQVEVEIKYVDLRESFLCGYLKIQGLTEDNPTLTTYFEGEIIGPKYGFITKHESWGATEKIDLSHWGKFSAFRQQQYHKAVRKGHGISMGNLSHRDNIFMRWKEHFLVPDHRVRTINGASFEGFYYICFNQKEGIVNGIYFHSRSEKFQQLELKHEEDRGCFGSIEFR